MAWEVLIARHNHRVVVSVVALGLRPEAARDITQEAWIRLIEQQRRGALSELTLPGLAIRQARFLALDHRRRQHPVVDLDAIREQSDGVDPEQRAVDRQRLRKALDALTRRSERDQHLFHDAYGPAAPSHRELAQRYTLSAQRVTQLLSEIRAYLYASLEDR